MIPRLILLTLLSSFIILHSSFAAESQRPNVVLMVADDMGYGDATCYWKTDLQTPVMDEVARQGIRVPAVMQWPGVIPPNSVSDESAVHFDIFATILAAAGVPVPARNGAFPVHGVNLLPLLRAPTQVKLPDRYLFWDLYGDVAALHGKWKMVGQISNHHGKFANAVREAEGAKFALYNLEADIGEQTDLSEKVPEIYRDLKTRHLEWLRQFAK